MHGVWYAHRVAEPICDLSVMFCAEIPWKVNSKTLHKTVLKNSRFPTADHIGGNIEDSLLEQLPSPVTSDVNRIVCADWIPCPISLLLGKTFPKFATWGESVGRHLRLNGCLRLFFRIHICWGTSSCGCAFLFAVCNICAVGFCWLVGGFLLLPPSCFGCSPSFLPNCKFTFLLLSAGPYVELSKCHWHQLWKVSATL